MGIWHGAKKTVTIYLIVAGIIAQVFFLWMVFGWPIYFDRWLSVSDTPGKANFILCITGGLAGNNLPTDDGWGRIYTAAQLYFDGYAPIVIFSGGGMERITEAEVYAEVAQWFGCPKSAVVFESGATSTAEHPARILNLKEPKIRANDPLIIVTSPLHSRRTALCFKKAGFTNFSMVTSYVARKKAEPATVRTLRESKFSEYKPSPKRYDDIFNRLRWRIDYFFYAVRELFAIGIYKLKGYV
jgi:uncharacterized SAM-binding protein YcdF (DUF218 family)